MFKLRRVAESALPQQATRAPLAMPTGPLLDEASMGDVFGLELDGVDMPLPPDLQQAPRAATPARKPVQVSEVACPDPVAQPAVKRRALVEHGPAPESAGAYVLGVLREHPNRECTVTDLYEWQTEPADYGKETLRKALFRLHEAGLVVRSTEGQAVYWAIAEMG